MFERSEFRSTRQQAERIVVASEQRMSDVVVPTTHEQEERATVFALCRALFVTFSRIEKVKIKSYS